jgi:hypothetical protein
MHALAHTESPTPGPQAPALHAVDVPGARAAGRLSAWDVSRYALGLVIGFLLAAVASGPGGAGIVAGQLTLAGAAAVVMVLAAMRHRALVRRTSRIRRTH